MMTDSRQKGFTLIEAIIVIAIIGILVAVAAPGIMSTIPRYKLRAEARELVINFKKAKIEAVKRNREVVILFKDLGTPGSSYQIYVNADGVLPRTFNDPPDIQLVNRQVQSNLQLVSTTFTNNQAGYNARGLPIQLANQNVVIGTTDGSRSYTLTVSLAGSVRIQ